jgi:golgin subfamily B member 1
VIARDNKIIELNNRILQLETSIMDYEVIVYYLHVYSGVTRNLPIQESLREKESVLEARTRAVALLQEDLGLKHAAALKHLEEARKEAADLKISLAEKEKQLKIDKQNLLDTIASKEQK